MLNINYSFCPICAENIGEEPFCSSCGDVSGAKSEEYSLHERDYYIDKQIKLFGKVLIKPVNYLPSNKKYIVKDIQDMALVNSEGDVLWKVDINNSIDMNNL